MEWLRASALVLLGVGVTLTDGMVHGRLSYRWRDGPGEMELASRRLQQLPVRFGDWRMTSSAPLEQYVIDILSCAGSVNRTYVNEKTGAEVHLALLLGPFGPMSTHTPDICYASREFEVYQPRRRVVLEGADSRPSVLWRLTLRAASAAANVLRVYYGFSDGGAWSAPERARLSFGGSLYLYKLQVVGRWSAAADRESEDQCRDFLQVFLPAAQGYLRVPQPSW